MMTQNKDHMHNNVNKLETKYEYEATRINMPINTIFQLQSFTVHITEL